MSYGSTSYGSVSYGSGGGGNEQVFLPFVSRAQGVYEGEIEYNGSETLFSVVSRNASDVTPVEVQIFTRQRFDDEPQSQGTNGGGYNYFQAVVGAARFISVRAEAIDAGGAVFDVRGRPGD